MKTETSDSGFLVLGTSTLRDGRVFLGMAEVCGYPRTNKARGPQLVAGVGPVAVQVV